MLSHAILVGRGVPSHYRPASASFSLVYSAMIYAIAQHVLLNPC